MVLRNNSSKNYTMRNNSIHCYTVILEDADSFLSRRDQVHVRFCESTDIVLIPTRIENREFSRNLYWTSTEIFVFKREAMEELNEIMFRQNLGRTNAKNYLYQSGAHNYTNDSPFSSLNIEYRRSVPDQSTAAISCNKNNDESSFHWKSMLKRIK